MDIIRNNIHMDRIKCRAVSQMSLEDDINLPETSPDLSKIIFREGNMVVSDVKVSKDHVGLKGILEVFILYLTEDDDEKLARIDGKIPFEETVYVEGAQPGDTVDVSWKIEDLSISVINSRKLSARSVVTFCLQSDTLFDEEAACDLEDADHIEYHLQQMEIARLAICKRDIYRVRQELELPAHMPNIFRLIWQSVKIASLEFKPLDDKISLNGELSVFLLYESTQENDNVQYYETSIPFSGAIDCQGSREMMIPDIRYCISSRDFEVRPDFDGEERGFSMELVLDLCIKLYEEENVSILSDVYGTRKDVEAEVKNGTFRKILMRNNGTCRLNEKLQIEGNPQILQLIHSEGEVYTEDCTITEEGAQIEGVIVIKCLYVTSDDKVPYSSLEQTVPFTYLLEAKGAGEHVLSSIRVTLDQLSVSMLDAKELEAKIALDIAGILFEEFEKELVTDIRVQEPDKTLRRKQPGIVVHMVAPGDTLWQIGKKYYMPVKKIKEMNALSGDEIRPGEKLLLVKERE